MTQFFSLLLWAGAALCFVAYYLDDTDYANVDPYIMNCLIFSIAIFRNSVSSSSYIDMSCHFYAKREE